jgi:hypothetical protein
VSIEIEFLSAVIVISDDPQRLAEFYGDALGLPLQRAGPAPADRRTGNASGG